MNWWIEVSRTIQQEFSDLADATQITQIGVRLFIAVLLGGLLGYERERKGSPAGLRTHMMVALGAALFVVAPLQAGMPIQDLSRVLQGIIAGIGFLGAGAIIKMSDKEDIKGLTTAASIWATAAIGMAVGMGREMTAILSTAFALVILAILPRLEKHIEISKQRAQSLIHPEGREE